MKKTNLFNGSMYEILRHQVDLYVEVMMKVSSEYGSSLTHDEFMDKAEEHFCVLLEENQHHLFSGIQLLLADFIRRD